MLASVNFFHGKLQMNHNNRLFASFNPVYKSCLMQLNIFKGTDNTCSTRGEIKVSADLPYFQGHICSARAIFLFSFRDKENPRRLEDMSYLFFSF